MGERRLDAEDGLHVGGGRGLAGAGEHQDGHPGPDGDARGEAPAADGYGARLVGVGSYGVVDHPQGVGAFLAVVAVARHVDHREGPEDVVRFQGGAERLGRADAGDDPQRVAEHLPVVGRRVGVEGGGGHEVEQSADVLGVDEAAVGAGAEELAEVERQVVRIVISVAQRLAEVVGQDSELGERGVGVGVATVGDVPLGLGALLHDVVPGEGLVGGVVVEEVERRAGERQHARLLLHELADDGLPQQGGDALVGLVDNEAVPTGGKGVVVLVELAPDELRAAQVLHGGEVDEASASPGVLLQFGESLALALRAVAPSVVVGEDFAEVGEPPVVDHRPVGHYYGAAEAHLADRPQRAERLAEAHLGVPEHLPAAGLEPLDGLADGGLLLGAEDNLRGVGGRHRRRPQAVAPPLGGLDGGDGRGEVADEPLVGAVHVVENLAADARPQEDFVDFSVRNGALLAFPDARVLLRVEEFIGDGRSLRILVYPVARRGVERLAVGRQRRRLRVVAGHRRLANLEATGMILVVDGENVYKPELKRIL